MATANTAGTGIGAIGGLLTSVSSLASPAAAETAFVEIKLEDSKIGADIVSVVIEDHDQWVDKATIVVDDPNAQYLQAAREGLSVTVDLGWKKHAVIFEGVLAQPTGICTTGGLRQTTLVALDLSHQMRAAKRTEDHVGDLSKILEKLVARPEYKKKIEVGKIEVEKKDDKEPTYTERVPLRQHGVSDWVLIQELAEKYQARAFVEYNEGSSKFYWVPIKKLLDSFTLGSFHYCQGSGKLLDFKLQRFAAGASEAAAMSVIDPLSGAVTSTPPEPKPQPEPAPAADPGTLARIGGYSPRAAEQYKSALELAAGAQSTPEDQKPTGGRQIGASDVQALGEKHGSNPAFKLGLRGTGRCVGTIDLRAKGKVSIYGIAPIYEGDWYLRSVRHVYTRVLDADRKDRSTYHSEFVATR